MLTPGPTHRSPRRAPLPEPQGPTLGELSRCRMMLCRFLVMWVSRLRARFQGLQIQWLSSPLGAEEMTRLCPGPTLLGTVSPVLWQQSRG